MIRTIRGKVIQKSPPRLIVESGGLGYGVFTPLSAFDDIRVGQEVFLHTHHQVAEDKQELYGFLAEEQRDFFEILLSVSGVGPKVALAIINSNTVQVLRSAIAEENAEIFAHASGVGRKIAERIIVDLKSKIGIQPGLAAAYGDTYEALRSLGYTASEVKAALQGLPQDVKDTQEQLKIALRALAKK